MINAFQKKLLCNQLSYAPWRIIHALQEGLLNPGMSQYLHLKSWAEPEITTYTLK